MLQFDMGNLRDLVPMCQTQSYLPLQALLSWCAMSCGPTLFSTYVQAERDLFMVLAPDCDAICFKTTCKKAIVKYFKMCFSNVVKFLPKVLDRGKS